MKLIDLEEAIVNKAMAKYDIDVRNAREQFLKALSGSGMSGWVNHDHIQNLDKVIQEVGLQRKPVLAEQAVQDFVKTYDQLILEFPELVAKAVERESE